MRRVTRTYGRDRAQVQLSSFGAQGGVTEYHLLISVRDASLSFQEQLDCLREAYAQVLQDELERDATPVFRRYFVSDAANQTEAIREWECVRSSCALSIVQQAPLNGTKVAMWTYLQTGIRVEALDAGMSEVSHNGYRHLWLGGAFSKEGCAESQTHRLLDDYATRLMSRGCTLADHCVRTWFFVQNVDVNYAGVVKARREVFMRRGLTEKTHYIASTGIEGRHADPAVFATMDAYAVRGIEPGQVRYLCAPSHLNPTYEYGVTFERGTAVSYGDRRQVFISGTASINNRGEILYSGDVLRQGERMMENITVLLREAGASTSDIAQAIVYLRDPADYGTVRAFFETRYPGLPHLIVWAPVCRPGWLVEMECMAIVPDDTAFKAL